MTANLWMFFWSQSSGPAVISGMGVCIALQLSQPGAQQLQLSQPGPDRLQI
jgi:hypothetical protein